MTNRKVEIKESESEVGRAAPKVNSEVSICWRKASEGRRYKGKEKHAHLGRRPLQRRPQGLTFEAKASPLKGELQEETPQ